MNNDRFYMEQALELAQQAAAEGEVPIGAIITSRTGAIVGTGYNQAETLKCQDQHAEMNAIRSACANLDDCGSMVVLFTSRLSPV